jgi:hypothetical protein
MFSGSGKGAQQDSSVSEAFFSAVFIRERTGSSERVLDPTESREEW